MSASFGTLEIPDAPKMIQTALGHRQEHEADPDSEEETDEEILAENKRDEKNYREECDAMIINTPLQASLASALPTIFNGA